jgi:primosomal protein N' (replication factor Y) (superfamily II helicase)
LRCPRCEAGMSYARAEEEIHCPRCGYRDRLPRSCPNCRADDLRFVGAGTERLLDQLRKTFPHARVERVDPADPSSVPEDVEVYVTTWIGTKPELRPDVSLVGVLNADWLVRRPDLRSAETAHQALVEMAEWAGPADKGGRLVIQTSDPGHHAIQALVRGDYDFFLERELEIRKELLYPPYTELVKLTATGPGSTEVLASIVSTLRSSSVRVLGPVGAASPRRGSQALLKCDDAYPVAAKLRDILPSIPRDVRISVDVDPR